MANTWPTGIIITGVLYFFTVACLAGRVAVSVQHRRVGLEDWMITIAGVLSIIQFSLLVASCRSDESDYTRSQHILFASSLFYGPSIVLAKVSAVYMLLQTRYGPLRHALLYTIALLQALSSTANTAFQIARCRPISSNWDSESNPNAKCVSREDTLLAFYIESGTGITVTLILTIFTTIQHRKRCRGFTEKLGLTLITILSLFSISANLVRSTLLHASPLHIDTTTPSTPPISRFTPPQWSILEQQALLITLCIPTLKSLFTRNLHRFSLHSSHSISPTPTPNSNSNNHHPHPPPPPPRGYFSRLSSSNDARPSSNPPRSSTSKKQSRSHPRARPRHRSPSLPFIATPALKSTIAQCRATPEPPISLSSETIWPAGYGYPGRGSSRGAYYDEEEEERLRGSEEERDGTWGDGGILLTTEFLMRSEVVSRMPSRDDVLGLVGGRRGGVEM
ncbi:unnamed protein product [Periconia digitata]|uniref:Rhodopsin domain-containing protein n=1 Tax=Periconia digitata TaxID=1303443 RepID=A0A9W4XRE8_9PLEO|nr:unnamed protein product [Periconia digitata]